MYKSSPFTFVFKYFFPVLFMGGIAFGIYLFSLEADAYGQSFVKGMSVMTIWLGIFLVQMPFRLKNIETTDTGLLIKDFSKQTFIDYKDIHWLSYFDLAGPWFVTIKYFDTENGMNKKICYMPDQNDQRFFANDRMTAFIKERLVALNPNYKKENQPSAVKNLFIGTLLALPFLALFLYFMRDQLQDFLWFLR